MMLNFTVTKYCCIFVKTIYIWLQIGKRVYLIARMKRDKHFSNWHYRMTFFNIDNMHSFV